MERGKTPREGWAALVLRHYHQRRAGVARIRQTWLPSSSIRQPDRHSHKPARAAITSSPRLRWSTDDQAGEFQSWRGPLLWGMGATTPKGLRLPARARSYGSHRERGLDHQTAR
jgi:hypothetical protein